MKTDLRKSLSTLDAAEVVDAVNAASRYPSKGTGGTLVPVDSWDGTGEVPAGWTAAVVAEDKGDGTAVVEVSAQDSARLDDYAAKADPRDREAIEAARAKLAAARAKLAAAGDAAARAAEVEVVT